jgi:hypothetical protein
LHHRSATAATTAIQRALILDPRPDAAPDLSSWPAPHLVFRLNVAAPPAGGKLQFAGDRASAEGGTPVPPCSAAPSIPSCRRSQRGGNLSGTSVVQTRRSVDHVPNNLFAAGGDTIFHIHNADVVSEPVKQTY